MGLSVSSAHKRTSQTPPPVNASFRRDLGSKEEAFFDSQSWLDSECEDDFYSVNGDPTPSCGNTPVHHNFARNPRVSKLFLPGKTPGSIPEPSPTLLQLMIAEDQHVDEQGTQSSQNMAKGKMEVRTTILNVHPSANSTRNISGANSACNSERTLEKDSIPEKPRKLAHCCLPSFFSFSAFTAARKKKKKKKKKKNPAIAVNG